MTGCPRTMKAAKNVIHKVMKKKTISSIGARVLGLKGNLFSAKIQQRAFQEKNKAVSLKLKVQKAAMQEKLKGKLFQENEKKRMAADLAAAREKDDALLSPEDLREKRKLEGLVSKDINAVIKKIAQDDSEEAMDESEALSEVQLTELNRAVDVAMNIFKEVWIAFVFEYDRGNADGDDRDDRAAAFMETYVAERYEEFRAAMNDLLPFLPALQPNSANAEVGDYTVFEVDGYKAPKHLQKGAATWRLLAAQYPTHGYPAMEKVMGASIACLRRDPKFRALEAFSAMMAVVCARKEKSFLEVFETRKELEQEMKKLQKQGLKVGSKTSALRKQEIRAWLEKQYFQGFGYFAHYLVKPHASMRLSFTPGVPGVIAPRPVSVVAVEHITLFDALGSPDTGDGSFTGVAKSYDWCSQEGTEFAFQLANLGIEEKMDNNKMLRENTEDLQANPELRTLLLSKKPIVYLEVTAALAPREVFKNEGLSKIVIAELTRLMRNAKSDGKAVLFCLGSDSPHKLAEKVYLRKPIGDYGLRCGYFRWRKSADVSWAREAAWEDRPCHCLQMP